MSRLSGAGGRQACNTTTAAAEVPARTLRPSEVRTARLVLRHWEERDHAPFAALNADPEVMACFPSPLTRDESNELAQRCEAGLATNGFGLWALELLETGEFIGFTGLSVPRFAAHFIPAVEIGWRLARSHWGAGYATEAATAALDDGFTSVGLSEVVSFTSVVNRRSRAVMERLGMTRDPAEDFVHPNLPPAHRLAPHVLCRTSAARWGRLRGQQQAKGTTDTSGS